METADALGDISSTEELLSPHYNRHFNCTECNFETTHARDFFYHKRDIHGNTAKIFECKLCPFASLYGKKLQRHLLLHTMDLSGEEDNDFITGPKVKPLTLKRLNVKMPFKVAKIKNKLTNNNDHLKAKSKARCSEDSTETQVYRMVLSPEGFYHYQCIDCLYYASIPSSVKKHHMLCHIRLLSCPHCTMSTRSQGIYYEHLMTHADLGYMKCPDCSYVTGAKSNYEKHRSFHSDGYPVKCSVCNFGAESESKIKRHVATQHMPDIVPQPVSQEEAAPPDYATQLINVKSEDWHRPLEETDQDDINDFIEASKNQEPKNILEEGLYEYRCPKCPMVCYRRGNFTRHLTAKHKYNHTSAAAISKNMESNMKGIPKKNATTKPKSKRVVPLENHKCSHCSYIAKWPSDLRRHMQVHTIVKRFKCPMCANKYKYLGDLNVHMRRDHNTEPPETVAREYTNLNVLKKASPVMYRCPICPYTAHTKADLEQHSRTHGNLDKTFQCRQCDYQTYWRGDVGRHLFRHHKIILSKDAEEIGDYFIHRPDIKPLTKQSNGGQLKIPLSSPLPSPDPGHFDRQSSSDFLKEGTPDSSKSSSSSIRSNTVKVSTKDGILVCEYPNCEFKSSVADRMSVHVAAHMDLKQFACPTCGKRTNWKWDIVKHMNKVHQNPTASVEDVITLSIEEAKASINDYLAERGRTTQKPLINLCSFCDFKSSDRKHVLKHIEVIHKNGGATVITRALIESTHGDGQTEDGEFSSKLDNSQGAEHFKFVDPPPEELAKYDKPYACAICRKSGSTKGDVKKHYNYTHPYKDVRILYVGDGTEFNYYTGEIYLKSLKFDSSLDNSEAKLNAPMSPSSKTLKADSKFSNPKMHGYVKPFKCSICGLRSNWKWDLKKHLRSKHPGEGGFVIMLSIEEALSTYGKDCSPSHPKHQEFLSIPKKKKSRNSAKKSALPVADNFLFKQPPSIKAEILEDSDNEGDTTEDSMSMDASFSVSSAAEESDVLGQHWKCSGCSFVTSDQHLMTQHFQEFHAFEKDAVKALLVSRPDGDVQGEEWRIEENSMEASDMMDDSSSSQPDKESKLWYCPSCSFQSKDDMSIVLHMKHHGMKPYLCIACGLSFPKKSILHQHILKVHKTDDYSSLATLNISYDQQMKSQQDHYVNSYCCQLCGIESDERETIYLHLIETHGSSNTENILQVQKNAQEELLKMALKIKRKLHFCKLCPYRSQKKSMLTFHMTYHKPSMTNKLKCKHCPYYVSTQRLLHQHQKKWHKDSNKLAREHEEQAPPLLSPHKPHMGHLAAVASSRRQNCEKCPYTTNSKNDFIYHKQFHRPKRTAEFKCEHCDYWVVHKRLLKQHMRLHKNKTCDNLGQSDSSPAKSLYSDPGLVYDPVELAELAAIKQKMIAAKITSSLPKSPGAEAAKPEPEAAMDSAKFVYKNGIYRRLNKCRFCPYTNTKARSMQLHEMMHGPRDSSENMFKCPYCDYHVGSKGLLTQHIRVHQPSQDEVLEDGNGVDADEDVSQPKQVDTLLQITRFKRFGCERCPYASAKRQHFERHLELHGSRQRYTCQYCDYSVPSSNLLLQHTKLHLMPNQNLLSSQSITNLQHLTEVPADVALASALPPADMETTVTVSVVHDHLGLYENSIYDSEPKKLYRCDRCPYANIRRDYLLSHLKFHMVPSALLCPYCDYSAPKQPLLTQHIRVHFCPLPELSDWLLENGQTYRETSQRHIDLGEALKVAQEYQNQSRKKMKATKPAAKDAEQVKIVAASCVDQTGEPEAVKDENLVNVTAATDPGQETNLVGKENIQETPPLPCICQYCDREFQSSEKLVKHELQHLIGNQFEDSVQVIKNLQDSEVQRGLNRKQAKEEKARKKRKTQKSPVTPSIVNGASQLDNGASQLDNGSSREGSLGSHPDDEPMDTDNRHVAAGDEAASESNHTNGLNAATNSSFNHADLPGSIETKDERNTPNEDCIGTEEPKVHELEDQSIDSDLIQSDQKTGQSITLELSDQSSSNDLVSAESKTDQPKVNPFSGTDNNEKNNEEDVHLKNVNVDTTSAETKV